MQPDNENTSTSKWKYEMVCPVCGEDFIATKNDKIYCDSRCKQKAYYERNLKQKKHKDDRNQLERLQEDYEALRRGHETTQKKLNEHYDNWESECETNEILNQELIEKDVRVNELEKELKDANAEINKSKILISELRSELVYANEMIDELA